MKTEYKIDDVKCTFDFVCPKKWEDLEINREGVRYCDHCYSDVFLCTKQEEVDEAKKLNRCIAVARVSRIIFMGEAIGLKDRAFDVDHMLKEADELFAARTSSCIDGVLDRPSKKKTKPKSRSKE